MNRGWGLGLCLVLALACDYRGQAESLHFSSEVEALMPGSTSTVYVQALDSDEAGVNDVSIEFALIVTSTSIEIRSPEKVKTAVGAIAGLQVDGMASVDVFVGDTVPPGTKLLISAITAAGDSLVAKKEFVVGSP